MFCPKCGQQNPDEAKFCGKCGAAVTAAAPPASPPAASFATAPAHVAAADTGAVSKTMKNVMMAVSIVVPIVGIVVGIIFVLDANPEKKAVGKLWLIVSGIAAVVWAALLNEG